MPDGPRESYRPTVTIAPCAERAFGFTAETTSGLSPLEIRALNRALRRLMEAGMGEQEAKAAIDRAVRAWLVPADAAEVGVEHLLTS